MTSTSSFSKLNRIEQLTERVSEEDEIDCEEEIKIPGG